MDNKSKPASSLSCLFAKLTEKYSENQLKLCETKDNQYWRQASGKAVIERINLFAKYFPELSLLIKSLENYSICKRHYNQIVANNNFLEILKADGFISSSSINKNPYKRRRNTIDNISSQSFIELKFHEISIQVEDENLKNFES